MNNIKFTPLLDTLHLENISDQEYFSEKYGGYISNSRLKLIDPEEGGSPQQFFEGLGAHKFYSDSLTLGSAVHASQLQPESFYICDTVDKPTAKVGFIADIVYDGTGRIPTDEEFYNACKEVDYYGGQPSEKMFSSLKEKVIPYIQDRYDFESSTNDSREAVFLAPKMRDTYYGCCKALNENKYIQTLLHPKGIMEDPISWNERTILLDVQAEMEGYEPVVLRLKSKLDNFTIDKEQNLVTVNDIKTTGKLLNYFDDAVLHFHYHRELAMYSWLISLCAQKFYNMDTVHINGNFLVVSTIPSYYTKVSKMTKSLYKSGWADFRRLLSLVAYYTMDKSWQLTQN